MRHGPLFDAIASEALKHLDDLSLQELSALVDVGLRNRRDLEKRLGRILFQFLERIPVAGGRWTRDSLQFLKELKVDSFGLQGSRFLLARRGICQPPDSFRQRAWERIVEYSSVCDSGKTFQNTTEVHKKAFAYLEYVFATPNGSIEGAILKDNGIRAPQVGGTRWITATSLPINASVDRNSCAEFQALTEACDRIAVALGTQSTSDCANQVSGGTRLLICGPSPCLSCVSAMLQFQAVLPGILLEVALGRYQVVQT